MPPLFHVRRVGAGRSPSLIVRRGTPRAPRRARSSAEASLSLGAVSCLLVAFTRVLLEDKHVATVAGDAFGAPGHIRLTYCTSEEDIREGVGRIAELLREARS